MDHWLSRDGLLEQAKIISESGEDLCIATLVEVKGSAPQELGAKIVIPRLRDPLGTIGGGKLEAVVIDNALALLSNSSTAKLHLLSWNLQRDIGMSCGGEVKVVFELVFANSPLSIAVFGAGHVGQALIPLLSRLKSKIYWYDDRKDWLDKGPEESAKLSKIILTSYDQLDTLINRLPAKTFIILLTKGHQNDLEVLRIVLKTESFPFIGVIGSKTKAKSLRSQLLKEGFPGDRVESFFCPIGENFGTNEPNEIAFSIIAQLLRVRDRLGL